MSKISLFLYIFLALIFNVNKAASQTTEAQDTEKTEIKALSVSEQKVENFPLYVYKDGSSSENNFFPTGNMGDFRSFWIDTYCIERPYSGSNCVQINYEASLHPVYGWAGLYWQYPPNNWGDVPKAYDLRGATKLTFWARGKSGGEVINKFQVGGITGEYYDSGVASIGPIALTREWKEYTIDLIEMHNPVIYNEEETEPLSHIIGGFSWATNMAVNHNKGVTFYLDEIKFEND